VQSLAAAGAAGNNRRRPTLTTPEELDLQYRAQVDVLKQLEDKVQRLLRQQQQQQSSTSSWGSASGGGGGGGLGPVVKLQRDFERVQARSKALQGGVERLKQQQAEVLQQQQQAAAHAAELNGLGSGSSSAGGGNHHHPSAGGGGTDMDQYEQVQLQMQQDVSSSFFGNPRPLFDSGLKWSYNTDAFSFFRL